MLKKDFKNGYTVINNDILRRKDISAKTKGLYCIMVSLPENWKFSINGLKAIMKESNEAISSGLKELEKFGLLKRKYYNDDKGYKKSMYYISDILFFYNFPNKENPTCENPTKENTSNYKVKNKTNKELKKEIKEKTFFSNEEINTLFLEYLNNRPKKKNTKRSINMLIKKCEDKTEEQIKEALTNSIANGWLGLFFEKEKNENIYEEPDWEKEKKEKKETKEVDINKLLKEKGLK